MIFEWETVGEGVKRKIMGYDDKIMLVHVAFEKDSIGPVHQHHHSQVTHVVSGIFDVTIGEKTLNTLKLETIFISQPMCFMVQFVLKRQDN